MEFLDQKVYPLYLPLTRNSVQQQSYKCTVNITLKNLPCMDMNCLGLSHKIYFCLFDTFFNLKILVHVYTFEIY